MNSKYFNLPPEKQKNLINAGYKAFALYPYKKASISIIADEANISKSLLFYYFKNKKEYYLFLFDTAMEFLRKEELKRDNTEKFDLFELVNQTIECRLLIMNDFPYLIKFVTRAYYESDDSVQHDLLQKKEHVKQLEIKEILNIIDYQQFKNASDAEMLINIILFITEGFICGQNNLDNKKINEILPLFQKMMLSLKNHYYIK